MVADLITSTEAVVGEVFMFSIAECFYLARGGKFVNFYHEGWISSRTALVAIRLYDAFLLYFLYLGVGYV